APYERYHPWYGRNYYGNYRRGSFNQANIVHNTNITNIYRNASVRNGVSGVSAANFGRGGINTRNFVRPPSGDLSRAGVVRGRSFDGGSVNNGSVNRPSTPQMRNDPPARTYAPPTRNDSPGGSMSRPSNRDGGQQPVRISPPMVRSNPGGGGYNRPAPSQGP